MHVFHHHQTFGLHMMDACRRPCKCPLSFFAGLGVARTHVVHMVLQKKANVHQLKNKLQCAWAFTKCATRMYVCTYVACQLQQQQQHDGQWYKRLFLFCTRAL